MNKETYELEEKLLQDFIFDFVKTRHNLGLTQKQMAEVSGVLRDKISKIEAGIYKPTLSSLLKILGPHGYTITIKKIDDN